MLFVFGDMTDKKADNRINYTIGAAAADPFLQEHGAKITTWATTIDRLRVQDPFREDVVIQIPHGETRPLHSRTSPATRP